MSMTIKVRRSHEPGYFPALQPDEIFLNCHHRMLTYRLGEDGVRVIDLNATPAFSKLLEQGFIIDTNQLQQGDKNEH